MAEFERKSAIDVHGTPLMSPMVSIDAHLGSPKVYYVNLGMPAINRDSMVQHVCGGRAQRATPGRRRVLENINPQDRDRVHPASGAAE